MNTTEGKTQDNHKKAKTAAEQTPKKKTFRDSELRAKLGAGIIAGKKIKIKVLLVSFSRNNRNAQGNGTAGIWVPMVWS